MVTTASGTIASFRAPESKPFTSLKVYFSPIQNGSGDPSPSNVRDISGRTEVQVKHCGKNLINLKYEYDQGGTNRESVIDGVTFSVQPDGSIIANGTATSRSTYYIHMSNNMIPAGKYYYSLGDYSSFQGASFIWDDRSTVRAVPKQWNGTTSATSRSNANIQVLFPDDYKPSEMVIGIRYNQGKTANNDHWYPWVINNTENSDNVTWEPYSGETISINWSSEASEAYAGYVDIVSGELVVTHKKTRCTQHAFSSVRSDDGTKLIAALWLPEDAACLYNSELDKTCHVSNIAKNGGASTVQDGSPSFITWHDDNVSTTRPYILIYTSSADYSTPQEMESYMMENFEVVYQLAVPLRYNLTPHQIQTLIGRNNIWSNASSVEVAYDFVETLDIIQTRQRILKGCQVYKTILPPGYEEYDWLQTSGYNARIDTGVSGDDTTLKLQSSFTPVELVNSYSGVFGNYKTENDNYCWRIICTANTYAYYKGMLYYTAGNGSPGGGGTGVMYPAGAGSIEMLNRRVDFIMTYGKVMYTSQTKTDYVTSTMANMSKNANTNNIAIGASNTGSTGGTTKFHIYRFKIWSHDKLIRDYHPCVRLKDNKAGFYDIVNYTFNPSIGSVDFIAGNDIGGLYVYADNSIYGAVSEHQYVNDGIVSNSDYFITGFYDTGSESEKSYSISCTPNDAYALVRIYNDKTGVDVVYKYINQNYEIRTFTATGRYIMSTVYKPNAANFYIYDNTNQRYVVKGANVT